MHSCHSYETIHVRHIAYKSEINGNGYKSPRLDLCITISLIKDHSTTGFNFCLIILKIVYGLLQQQ